MNAVTRDWKKAAKLFATGFGMAASVFLTSPDIASGSDITARGHVNTHDAHYNEGHGRGTTTIGVNIFGGGLGGSRVYTERHNGPWVQEEGTYFDGRGNQVDYTFTKGRPPRSYRHPYPQNQGQVVTIECPPGYRPVKETIGWGPHKAETYECR